MPTRVRVIAGELKGQRAGRAARLEGAADLRPRPRGDLLGARRAGRGRPRPRPLLRHRGAGDRGALARRRRGGPGRPRHPRRRSATSSGSASASGPSWSAPTSGAGWRRVPRTPAARRFDLVFVDAPYRLADRVAQELDTHLPRASRRGRAGGRRERRPPAAADRLARAAAPAPLRRRRRLHLRRGRASERAQNGTVVCPGSYDPVTNGHLDIITRTSERLRAGRRRRRQQPGPQGEDALHRRGAQGVHRGGDRRPAQRRGADLRQPAGRVRPRTTTPRRSSRACGRSPTSSTSSRWRS